jgi:hypothetical protein
MNHCLQRKGFLCMDSRRKQGRSRWLLVMVLSFAAMAVTIVKIKKKV